MTSIPNSVLRVIDGGSFVDEVWQLPDEFPPASDIATAMLVIEPLCKPINPEAISIHVDRLIGASECKIAPPDRRVMVGNWTKGNGDLPADLWTASLPGLARKAAADLSMPEPQTFRAMVIEEFMQRLKHRDRIYRLYDAHRESSATPAPTLETLEQREIAIRDGYLKHGYLDRAAYFERKIAEREGREPAPWISDIDPETFWPKRPETPTLTQIGAASHALLLRMLAAKWQRCGVPEIAQSYLAKAQQLHPVDDEVWQSTLSPEVEGDDHEYEELS